jgi:signal transduction histidine kinase
VATGLIAALFQPVRGRVQMWVNRLLYGDREDPYGVLVRLGQRLENTLAVESVLPTIVQTVAEALRLPHAAITVLDRHGEELELAATGRPHSATIRLPLVFQGEPVGSLLLAPRAPGEAFSGSDREVLDSLARQAGVAVHAVRLNAELQRARERLVAAREEERRRLRRDLHDGLGSQMVGLSLQLGGVRTLIAREPDAAAAQVGEIQAELRGAVTMVRQLVHDLRPPTLDELGLIAAVRQLADRHDSGEPPRIVVESSAVLPTLPAAVEVALYRITQEALTNTLKHARARNCRVSLQVRGQHIELAIADDGAGMPSVWTPGVGLGSMRERAEELGGEFQIVSTAQDGTRILVQLPLRDLA